MAEMIRIGIVGNPNSGKTTLFNELTGSKQRVGNWPGVTVEKKSGYFIHQDRRIEAVDLPGIYSLSSTSLDEEIARDYILKEKPDLIVNIVDASNLERNLYLTTQLIEMKVPLLVVLNMMDMVRQRNIRIKTDELARLLDCPVVTTVANKGKGLEEAKDMICQMSQEKKISTADVYFPKEIEEAIGRLQARIGDGSGKTPYDPRWAATKLLEEDIETSLISPGCDQHAAVEAEKNRIRKVLGEDPDILIADSRYGFVNSLCRKTVDKRNAVKKTVSDNLDRIFLNRFLGIPLFLAAMYFTFWITINFGGCFIDFFDGVFGTVFVDGFRIVLEAVRTPVFLTTLLANGVGGGIQTVATFIPPIFFIFLCLAILEDSGYMARAAFVMDRFMRWIGLPGKAFVPMLVGFGCNVPAIMATRTLDNEKDRIMTIMMNPFMSCGARLPVYALFTAAFFPKNGGNVIFALYLTGIVLAIMTGFILKKTLLKGRTSAFILELPPYHIPTFQGVLVHTWERLKAFIWRAGKAILLVVVILSFLNSLGTDGSFGNENSEKSVLSKIGKSIAPIFRPMGMTEENWPAAVGIFTGIFAKEAVVGTLDALYSKIDTKEAAEESKEESFDLAGGLRDALATIPKNLSGLELPFSFTGLIGADVDSAVEDLEVKDETYSALKRRFDGKAGAFAYLLMILLYMPCVAAVAAVYRELNLGWTIFSSVYLSALAWLMSTAFYQVSRFGEHPASSLVWIVFCLGVVLLFIVALGKVSTARKEVRI
ncbi:MAG: Fe(2+) transporter permease subunit FeoB [Candidatus Omnitrophota bacterium]|jgi:ferrous iron transport protein B